MTVGRPPKFRTKEERDAARREQVRKSVQSYRRRKLEKEREEQVKKSVLSHRRRRSRKQLDDEEEGEDQLLRIETWRDEQDSRHRLVYNARPVNRATRSACNPFDIDQLSDQPQVELSFGFFPAIVQDFERATSRYPWSLAQTELKSSDNFLNRAILAGGARVLSSIYKHEGLTNISRMAYQETLVKTRQRMERFSRGDALPLICAMTALANFEVGDGSSRTQGTKWAVHTTAILKMIRDVGPEMFQTPVGLELLRGQRYTAIVMAMWDSSNNFLDEYEWRTVPYLIEGKTKEDELWDLVFELPRQGTTLMKLVTQIKGDSDLETIRKTATFHHENVHRLQNNLRQWAEEYETIYSPPTNPNIWPQPAAAWFTKHITPTARDVFNVSLHYPSLMQAESYVRLWTVQFKLLEAATATYNLLLQSGEVDLAESWAVDFNLGPWQRATPLTSTSSSYRYSDAYCPPNERASQEEDCDSEALIFKICRSMEFTLGPDQRDLRGAIISGNVPFQVAVGFLSRRPEHYAPELSWCEGVGEMLARRCLLQGKPMEVLTDINRK